MMTAILGGLVILGMWLLPRRTPRPRIPGLSPHSPALGNLPDIAACGSFQRFLTKHHQTYGAIFSFWYGQLPAISLSDPKYNACIAGLLTHHLAQSEVFASFLTAKFMGGTNGSEWKRRRRMHWDMAFSPKVVSGRLQEVNESVAGVCKEWGEIADSGEALEVRSFFFKFAIEALFRFAFGVIITPAEKDRVFNATYEFWNHLEKKLHGTATPQELELLDSGCASIRAICEELIAQRRQHPGPEDLFIDFVLGDKDPDVVYSEIASALMGGTHATSLLLTWCIYYLARHPEQQTRIFEQLQSFKGVVDATVASTVSAISEFIDESLRMSLLTTFVQRFNDGPDILLPDGYVIPSGTLVMLNAETLLWSSAYFPNPCEFNPARFSDPECRKQSLFFPFSFPGGRSCPGRWVAQAEVSACLATLVRNFHISFDPKQKFPVGTVASFFTSPKESIFIQLKRRDT